MAGRWVIVRRDYELQSTRTLVYYPLTDRFYWEVHDVVQHPGHATEAEARALLQKYHERMSSVASRMGPIRVEYWDY